MRCLHVREFITCIFKGPKHWRANHSSSPRNSHSYAILDSQYMTYLFWSINWVGRNQWLIVLIHSVDGSPSIFTVDSLKSFHSVWWLGGCVLFSSITVVSYGLHNCDVNELASLARINRCPILSPSLIKMHRGQGPNWSMAWRFLGSLNLLLQNRWSARWWFLSRISFAERKTRWPWKVDRCGREK